MNMELSDWRRRISSSCWRSRCVISSDWRRSVSSSRSRDSSRWRSFISQSRFCRSRSISRWRNSETSANPSVDKT